MFHLPPEMRCLSRAELEASDESFYEVDTVVLYYLVVRSVFYHEGEEAYRFYLYRYKVHESFLHEVVAVSVYLKYFRLH